MSRRGFRSSGSGRRARTLSRFRPSRPNHIADNAGRSEKSTANINQLYLTAIDSEFKAMRAEIGRLIDHQRDLQNLSYISLAALLAFIGVLAKDARGLAIVLLFVPFLSLQFAFTAADISRRILQLGRYVDALAADVNTLLGRSGGRRQPL
jgi:small basic protein